MASGCFVRRFFVSRFPLVWFRLDGRRRLHTSLLPRCGVAYDSYELSDIVDPRVGDYSVYVLPNAFSLSDGEKAAIARLETAGKRIVRIPEPIGVDELRARLASAGAHVYLDTGDVVFAPPRAS